MCIRDRNRQISGTVSDANGHPVAGATVIGDGTSLGTTTNTAGEYTLSAPVNGTLVVTFVGFEPQQLPIAGKTRINVTMKEDAQAIDDVIVVAFGTAKKEAFTGSAAVIKSDEIAKVQTSNVATALVGRVAGVQKMCIRDRALEVEREDRTRRIAFHTETGARYEVDGTLVRHQVGHLLFQVRIDEVRRPAEILGFDVAGRKSQLDTRRFQTGDVKMCIRDRFCT